MKILVHGPRKSGRSELVRRVMSLYHDRVAVPGGVGELPRGYKLSAMFGELAVLGNYENTTRDRHGMCEFDRYKADFVAALDFANKQTIPVLCEGGFLNPRRLDSDTGRIFCKGALVIWLSPYDTVPIGIDSDSFWNHHGRATITVSKMVMHGATRINLNRDDALSFICGKIDDRLDPKFSIGQPHNYR